MKGPSLAATSARFAAPKAAQRVENLVELDKFLWKDQISLKMFWVKNDILQEPLISGEKVCHGVGGGERINHIRYEMDHLRQKQF